MPCSLHELGRALAIARHRAAPRGSGRSHSQSARKPSAPTRSSERVLDPVARHASVVVDARPRGARHETASATRDLDAAAGRSPGRPGATNWRRVAEERDEQQRGARVASSTSRPFARCATAEASDERHREHTRRAACGGRGRARARSSRGRARARSSARPSGTPGGSTPPTAAGGRPLPASGPRRSRSARRTVANQASSTGVAGRRTDGTVAPPETAGCPEGGFRPSRRAGGRAAARPPCPARGSRAPGRRPRAGSPRPGPRPCRRGRPRSACAPSGSSQRPDALALAVRALVDGHLDDLEVLLAQLEQVDQPVLGHLVLDQAHDRPGRARPSARCRAGRSTAGCADR